MMLGNIVFVLKVLCIVQQAQQGQGLVVGRKDVDQAEVVYPQRIHATRKKDDLSTEVEEGQHEDTLNIRLPTKQEGDLHLELTKRQVAPSRLLLRTYDEEGAPMHKWHDQPNCFYTGEVKNKRESNVHVSTCDAAVNGYVEFDSKKYELQSHDDGKGSHKLIPVKDAIGHGIDFVEKKNWLKKDQNDEGNIDGWNSLFTSKIEKDTLGKTDLETDKIMSELSEKLKEDLKKKEDQGNTNIPSSVTIEDVFEEDDILLNDLKVAADEQNDEIPYDLKIQGTCKSVSEDACSDISKTDEWRTKNGEFKEINPDIRHLVPPGCNLYTHTNGAKWFFWNSMTTSKASCSDHAAYLECVCKKNLRLLDTVPEDIAQGLSYQAPANIDSKYLPYMSAEQISQTRYVELFVAVEYELVNVRFGGDTNRAVREVLNHMFRVDQAFSKINIRIVVSAMEVMNNGQSFQRHYRDGKKELDVFGIYVRKLKQEDAAFKDIPIDDALFLTKEDWGGGFQGMGNVNQMCQVKRGSAASIAKFGNVALTAHELGHNFGFSHVNSNMWHSWLKINRCTCIGTNCLMESLVTHYSGFDFTDCDIKGLDFLAKMKPNKYIDPRCLNNVPKNIAPKCGNGILEPGEGCDCGTTAQCATKDPCCEATTCRKKTTAQCAQ